MIAQGCGDCRALWGGVEDDDGADRVETFASYFQGCPSCGAMLFPASDYVLSATKGEYEARGLKSSIAYIPKWIEWPPA